MLRRLLILALLAAAPAAQAAPVFLPGVQVGLEPAGDLKAGQGRAGFQDLDRNTTVAIAEFLPDGYDQLVQAMRKPPAGATEVKREAFSTGNAVGYLHQALVVVNGTAIRRWLLVAKSVGAMPGVAALVNVNVPEAASKIYSDAAVRKMLASITFREPPLTERLGLLPFKLDDLAGFRAMRVTQDSALLIDGATDDLARNPYVVVSIGTAQPAQMDDRARFSRDLLARAPLRDLRLASADNMRIGGWPGFEIRGNAKGPDGNSVSVVQWVRFGGGGYVRIVGISPTGRWGEMFNRFRAVRDGVDLR